MFEIKGKYVMHQISFTENGSTIAIRYYSPILSYEPLPPRYNPLPRLLKCGYHYTAQEAEKIISAHCKWLNSSNTLDELLKLGRIIAKVIKKGKNKQKYFIPLWPSQDIQN